MSFGIQTFIGGTSFDVWNNMSPTYVLEAMRVYGTGSKTYTVQAGYELLFTLMTNTVNATNTSPTFSIQNGDTVVWNTGPVTVLCIVFIKAT